jgi:hypothetical protein
MTASYKEIFLPSLPDEFIVSNDSARILEISQRKTQDLMLRIFRTIATLFGDFSAKASRRKKASKSIQMNT